MPRGNKTYLTLSLVLAFLCLFPLAMPESFHIDQTKSPLFERFPLQIGEWAGKDVEVDQRTYEILETRNVLSRVYTHPAGDEVHLLLVSSNRDRRVAHPPEVCYLSSNYTITGEAEHPLRVDQESLPVKEFMAVNERDTERKEHVLYLYKIGEQFTTNYYSQQLRFAVDKLTRQKSEVLLIRLAGANRDRFPAFLAEVLKQIRSAK